ncbi:DUF72 domain-containing protein [Pedobacter sp. BMA]|uniref:DUF72 domain-containing protein n=1 Tax=Pedobacter sp. BMA TaxID=1663685 RepID=UPI000649AB07|nr:DUF72 domain-containing protein [Pedobacter sp. BMA]KLT64351.1 hypothetical protein AB669_17495 [Pedobacter sp. BMA]
MLKTLKNYYSGTSGLMLPVPNKSHYPEAYQDKSRLNYYASLSNSIEINSSFYKIPRAVTLQKWASEVPDDFAFTFKLFKGITHNANLSFSHNELELFLENINAVGAKKACLLIQLPPSITINRLPAIAHLLSTIKSSEQSLGWELALECRHASLYDDGLKELLEDLKVTMVVHDRTGLNTPLDWDTSPAAYLRFHGPQGNYRDSYTEDFLTEYASYINEWLGEGKKVYVYFNNTMGNAHGNMTTLMRMVEEAAVTGL